MIEYSHIAGEHVEFIIFPPHKSIFKLAVITFRRKVNERIFFMLFIGSFERLTNGHTVLSISPDRSARTVILRCVPRFIIQPIFTIWMFYESGIGGTMIVPRAWIPWQQQ